MELALERRSFRVERKTITLELCQNAKGRFLRITEEVRGRYNTVIVPVSGFQPVLNAVNDVIAFSKTLSPEPAVPRIRSRSYTPGQCRT